MPTMEERRNARQDRLDARRERIAGEVAALDKKAQQIADAIPFGQPILVGHHSEGRHRRDLAKLRGYADKAVALTKQANAVPQATSAILASDSDAIEQLSAKIARETADLQRMRAANVLVRKKDRAGLVALMQGNEARADALLHDGGPMACPGFANWAITNLAANIRRQEQRLATLAANKATASIEQTFGDVAIREDVELQRVQIIFPTKPDPLLISVLKAEGFRWAPSQMAWQRHLNSAGRQAAARVRKWIEARP